MLASPDWPLANDILCGACPAPVCAGGTVFALTVGGIFCAPCTELYVIREAFGSDRPCMLGVDCDDCGKGCCACTVGGILNAFCCDTFCANSVFTMGVAGLTVDSKRNVVLGPRLTVS